VVYSLNAQSLSIQKKTKVAPSAYQNFGTIVGDYLYLGADDLDLFKVKRNILKQVIHLLSLRLHLR